MEMALILFVLVMGLALGWMLAHSTVRDYYLAQAEELETALKWEKAKVQALASDLEKIQEKQSALATEMVQQLVTEKVQVSEKAKAQMLEKGWGWVLGQEQENSPKQ